MSDYRSFLKQELDRRKEKNPFYSLRAFARDLEMSPQMVSQLLRGKRHLSVISVSKVADKLKYTQEEKRDFYFLFIETGGVPKEVALTE